jgi:hypothetical protein
MPRVHDEAIRARGTRFRLYPQAAVLETIHEPETVWVSPPPGSIGPGPADDRMYVVDAIAKRPYEFPYLPPYRGPENPRVPPGRDGHFDHLAPSDPGFAAAHMYGTIRRVLDVWEGYFGRTIEWHFRDGYKQLELVPAVDWDNAHSGYGFIEMGYDETEDRVRHPFSLNFDVLAHELGHSILFAEIGTPPPATMTAEYRGFHESAADLVALVAALHFDSVVDRLLHTSHGNLYVLNEVNRIGELSDTQQVRVAVHDHRMSDVPDPRTPATALTQPEIHHLGEPLTGAIFDIFVEVFQADLVAARLIGEDLAALSYGAPHDRRLEDAVARGFARAYRGRHSAFEAVLLGARDYLGALLAGTWTRLSPHLLRFAEVGSALIAADRALSGGRQQRIIRESLAWREIGLPMEGRNAFAQVSLRGLHGLSYRERWRLARHGLFY